MEPALASGKSLDDELGVVIDEDRHLTCTSGQIDGPFGGPEHGVLRMQHRVRSVGEHLAALFRVRAVEPHDYRDGHVEAAERVDDSFRNQVASA